MQTNHSASFNDETPLLRVLSEKLAGMSLPTVASRQSGPGTHRKEDLQVVHADEFDPANLLSELANETPALGATDESRQILGQLGLDSGIPSDGNLMRMLTVREVIHKTRNDPAYTRKGMCQDLTAAGIECH